MIRIVKVSINMQPERNNLVAKFKTHLKKFMKKHKVTRMDLVREEGFSYPTIMKWETDGMQHLDADLVLRLTKRWGVEFHELVYLVEENE